ncbi:ABC transporter ATP-binding protein [Actinophytocola oryzae]|uniref:Putative ABC transport system ATP-binding protein n=1 Tax=Actinophytocola oryzae TaxID=502181 RepID=A0A4R7UTP9_9PSEU|nr:ABC transporter ATP-binding protein [Actinophytocola oryzae]TDV37761.1 putative ABC transport system ATP-binding protein [Actinophytocola oryzae]
MNRPVLELTDVVREYPGSPPVRALARVSLTVTAGEWVAIAGPSGSGKSTLLNLMGALDRPTSGTVRIDGHDVGELSDERLSGLRGHALGFVFQSFHLLRHLSAVDNVAVGLTYRGVGRAQRRARAVHVLERVGLGHRLDHRPSQLSGGESQRVAIARALVGDPALVLADEPTGNLDTRTGADILGLFADLHAEGATIVLITHDEEVAAAAPRRVHVRDGRLSGVAA